MEHFDILIIGAGAAGISAGRAAWEAGCRSILLVDRQESMGGILRQCMHHGFGSGQNGPEYIEKLIDGFPERLTVWKKASVTEVREDRSARILGPEIGVRTVFFRQLILAAGCREIPMGALPIAGTRPDGIYTAGQMQEMMNLYGHHPEGLAVILGSGDLGLIMAKQLANAGCMVALVEQRESCGGMARNQQCLALPNVQLRCGTSITEVFGQKTVAGVRLSDGSMLPCNMLLIAVGLQPEREVIYGFGEPDWLHICGNCRRVHPMVESVVQEGANAGITAWKKIRGKL